MQALFSFFSGFFPIFYAKADGSGEKRESRFGCFTSNRDRPASRTHVCPAAIQHSAERGEYQVQRPIPGRKIIFSPPADVKL